MPCNKNMSKLNWFSAELGPIYKADNKKNTPNKFIVFFFSDLYLNRSAIVLDLLCGLCVLLCVLL